MLAEITFGLVVLLWIIAGLQDRALGRRIADLENQLEHHRRAERHV